MYSPIILTIESAGKTCSFDIASVSKECDVIPATFTVSDDESEEDKTAGNKATCEDVTKTVQVVKTAVYVVLAP